MFSYYLPYMQKLILHRVLLLLKEISHSPLGMNILRLTRVGFNLFSKSSYMNINRPCIARIIIAPYKIKQHVSTVHFIRIGYKKLKYIIFLGCETYLSSLYIYTSVISVHDHVSGYDSRSGLSRYNMSVSSLNRLDSCLHLKYVKWLCHVIIRAIIKS